MIALLLAAAILAGGQGPARVPDREAHVIAMRALARAAIERDPEFNRAGQEALRRAVQVSGDQRERRLNDVIATHSDAWFENGVQVGAQARATLDDLPQSIRLLRVPKRDPASSRLASAMLGWLRTILCCAVLQAGAFAGV